MQCTFKYMLTVAIIILFMQGCSENPSFLEENAEFLGTYPVLANVSGFQDQYASGDTVSFKLEYFSEGEIESINLYEMIISGDDTTSSQIFSRPYEPAFSERLRLDTMMVTYTVPEASDNTSITLTSEIVNTNELTDAQFFTFEVTNNL